MNDNSLFPPLNQNDKLQKFFNAVKSFIEIDPQLVPQ